jgi:PAS domain S-box-containing protein
MTDRPEIVRRRQTAYWVTGVGLTVLLLLGHGSEWRGGAELHTVMEAVSTMLAMTVGAMALVRYYSKPETLFLFIGAGFLGTGFLDGFHTIVTSSYFKPMMPSDLPALIPWSWVASRQFLSIIIFLSYLAWVRESKFDNGDRISAQTVYLGSAVFTIASFLFFVFAPLPRAYYPEFFFHRPEEFAPALFFLLALIGYLRKGHWRSDAFEHWLVLSLVVGLVSQAVFMSHSGVLFDFEFDAAHTLKKVSYICVLTGLLINIYVTYRREMLTSQSLANSESRVQAIVDTVIDGIITIDEKGVVATFNPAAEYLFGYTASEVINQNVKMLMPSPYHDNHDGFLHAYRTTRDAKIIGIGREVVGRRKDGSTFPMDLAVSETNISGAVHFIGIVRDITERKQAETAKAEFISTVSHELRTPLTSIKGALGLIRTGVVGDLPEKLGKMLDIAYNNSDRLIRLINDILDIEKIESGKMEYTMEPVAVGRLLEQAMEENKGYGDEHGVRFVLSGEHQTVTVKGDQDRLMQVLANLMSNAAKFSPKDGDVEIALIDQDQSVRITVTDHGPGIPEEFRNKIFGKFLQADSSDTRQKGGTGLGLNITRAIVEHHDGLIGFESELGKGATFYVDLPKLIEVDAESPTPLNSSDDDLAHILHVEDDQDILDIVSSVVTDYAVTTSAKTLAQARLLLAQEDFDLVILDIVLPDGKGEELLPLPARKDDAPTPVVIFSVTDTAEIVTQEAHAILIKSRTSNEMLLKTIKSAINGG